MKTCNTKEVNEERQILFSRDNKVIENMSSDQYLNLQSDDGLNAKNLMIEMLANGVGKK